MDKLRNVEVDIKDFEQSAGVIFPVDFRTFLSKHNGMVPTKTDFDFLGIDGEESSLIQSFIPIGSVYSENIKLDYEYLLKEERIPVGYVPIAYDPFGNFICISLLKSNYGEIWFWDHELEDEETNLFYVSKTFTDFLDSLYIEGKLD